MTKQELITKLSDLEWEDFEVKSAKGGLPKDTWETISAFSNTSGGWLVFGIKQNGKTFEVQGLKNAEKIEQDLLNSIRSGKFNVFVSTTQAKHTIDGKIVLAFYIPPSKHKPVYYNSLQNSFIRRGSSDQQATKEEIDSMFRDQTFGTKTSELAPNTSKADIHATSLKQYRNYMTRFNPDVSYNRFDEDEFLTKLRILENNQLTYAGLLFLGKRDVIEKHFADFRIDLLEIPGTSITNATSNYTFRLDEHENLWDYYFGCFQRLKQKVDVSFQITDQGFGQELSPGLKAIREALVNMLMHADYFAPANARIRVFSNHIEFYNPGGLPKPLEELKAKDLSLPRNPLISKLFRMVRLAENAGYGFDKIESNWKAYNQTAPEYLMSFDATILKFNIATDSSKNNNSKGGQKSGQKGGQKSGQKSGQKGGQKSGQKSGQKEELTKRQMDVLKLIINNRNITRKELSEELEINESAIQKHIQNLKKKNALKRIGSNREGYWEIANQFTNN